jgi:hypothetical protein
MLSLSSHAPEGEDRAVLFDFRWSWSLAQRSGLVAASLCRPPNSDLIAAPCKHSPKDRSGRSSRQTLLHGFDHRQVL